MTTITAAAPDTTQTTSPLTPFDVFDIAEAIRNAVAWNCTSLNARDRQALALLTYAPRLRGITRMLAAKLANETATLPMSDALAMHLLHVNGDDTLPDPSDAEGEAWLNARHAKAVRHAAIGTVTDDDELTFRSIQIICDLSDEERTAISNALYEPDSFNAGHASTLHSLADKMLDEAHNKAPHLAHLLTCTAEPQQQLTAFDVLDITDALRNVTTADCTRLTAQDRQALALLSSWAATPPASRVLLSWLADPNRIDVTLPLQRDTAAHLLTLIDLLPEVSEQDVDTWLAARHADTPCVIDRIVTALATDAATRIHTPAGHTLYGALQTVLRIGRPEVPLDLIPGTARHEIDTALADLDLDADELLAEPQPVHPTPDPVQALLDTIATYAAEFSGDNGGNHLMTVLSAALIAANDKVSPQEAVQLARSHEWDHRIKTAGQQRDAMVERIRRDHLTAIDNQPHHDPNQDTHEDTTEQPDLDAEHCGTTSGT